jgi:hypothetical protein
MQTGTTMDEQLTELYKQLYELAYGEDGDNLPDDVRNHLRSSAYNLSIAISRLEIEQRVRYALSA